MLVLLLYKITKNISVILCKLFIEKIIRPDIMYISIIESEVMQMYRSAIVNELGHVMFWCDDLRGYEQIECILNGHPEWSVKCVEL